jgi:hypothetical protein
MSHKNVKYSKMIKFCGLNFKTENISFGVNCSDVNAISRVVSYKVTLQEVKRSSPLIASLSLHASAHTLM